MTLMEKPFVLNRGAVAHVFLSTTPSLMMRIVLAAGLLGMSAVSSRATSATVLAKGEWTTEPALTLKELKGFTSTTNVVLCEYGGWANSPWQGTATGFFRTEKRAGRWWLLDPHGHSFLSVGLCSVNQSQFSEAQRQAKFSRLENWVRATGQLLQSAGFNTLGCWSEWPAFRKSEQRMPYTPRWNFMLTYKNQRSARNGSKGFPNQCMPVFDPEFESFCDRHAGQLAATRDDPWLLGHFSDNELPFRPDALNKYLALPATDPGHQAAAAWWADRAVGHPERPITGADQDAFLEFLARRYYGLVSRAIKKHDPNHLYLGSRIHGRTIRDPVFRGSQGVDVVSVNYYHRWSVERERLDRWVSSSGRPFLISEWYAKAVAAKDTATSGAGFRVQSDRDRGLFYQNFTLGLLKHPGCVGWHWFKYAAGEENTHHGLVDDNFDPYADLIAAMRELNRQIYPLAEWLGRGTP